MFDAGPTDDRLLLERPLREAARIYGHRLYNVVSLCALLSMAFYIVLGVEQATHLTHYGPLPIRDGHVSLVPLLQVLLGLAGGAVIGTSLALVVVRRERRKVAVLRAMEELDAAEAAMNTDDFERALLHAQSALDLFRRQPVPLGQARTLLVLGTIANGQEQYDVAETHLLKSRHLFEILKDHAGVADATEALAEVANDRGRFDEAEVLYRRSLTNYERVNSIWDRIGVLINLANVENELGKDAAAEQLRAEAQRLIQQQTTSKDRRERIPHASSWPRILAAANVG